MSKQAKLRPLYVKMIQEIYREIKIAKIPPHVDKFSEKLVGVRSLRVAIK